MKILLIEDEKEIVDFLKPSLTAELFHVDVAYNGEKGISLAKKNKYDLIILDNMLPLKNGSEVCREVRKDNMDMPILILSVISETEKKVELLNAGADDYITKPFSVEELLARVRALLRRPKKIQNQILKIYDLQVNLEKRTVLRGEKEIYLTKKEYLLLEFLMKNKNVVVSRSMLLENVWYMDSDPFSNTIESHIKSLRKKINLPEKKKLIHTISGRGYKIY